MLKQFAQKCSNTLVELIQNRAQMKISDESIIIKAPAEKVWQYLTAPDLIPLWQKGVHEVVLAQEGSSDDVQAWGSFRELYFNDGTIQQQIVTDWQPGKALEYSTLEEMEFEDFGIHMHVGLFKLNPCAEGTELQWINYLEYYDTMDSAFWITRLMRQYRRNLTFLKWCLENAKITL